MAEVKTVISPVRDGGTVLRSVTDGETEWAQVWRGSEKGWVDGGGDLVHRVDRSPRFRVDNAPIRDPRRRLALRRQPEELLD